MFQVLPNLFVETHGLWAVLGISLILLVYLTMFICACGSLALIFWQEIVLDSYEKRKAKKARLKAWGDKDPRNMTRREFKDWVINHNDQYLKWRRHTLDRGPHLPGLASAYYGSKRPMWLTLADLGYFLNPENRERVKEARRQLDAMAAAEQPR